MLSLILPLTLTNSQKRAMNLKKKQESYWTVKFCTKNSCLTTLKKSNFSTFKISARSNATHSNRQKKELSSAGKLEQTIHFSDYLKRVFCANNTRYFFLTSSFTLLSIIFSIFFRFRKKFRPN